ncbi:MAG: sensor histidine kinase [Bacteroidota bacterium]
MYKITDEELLKELEKRFSENKSSISELQKLTKQLKEVNARLEESESLKSHFISNITNEIINPFAAILGLSRNILDVKKEDWNKAISMVQMIHSEAFHLDFQLKNIFAAAKLEAGDWMPEIVKVDIFQMIENLVETFKYEANKKGITFLVESELNEPAKSRFYFYTDAEKLKIILSNLISNAVNFSHNENEVIIKVWLQETKLCVSVIDHGVGVSEVNKKIIFDRFKRLDSGINSINRGHGLGLSVNKAILDLLNGSIELESYPNKKTTFTVCLPPGEVPENDSSESSDGNEFLFDDDNSEMF